MSAECGEVNESRAVDSESKRYTAVDFKRLQSRVANVDRVSQQILGALDNQRLEQGIVGEECEKEGHEYTFGRQFQNPQVWIQPPYHRHYVHRVSPEGF